MPPSTNVRGRVLKYRPPEEERFREAIGWAFRRAAGPGWRPAMGPLALEVHLYIGEPAPGRAYQGFDVDNPLKALLDALAGVAYVNDRQAKRLADVVVHDRAPEGPLTVVGLYPVDPAQFSRLRAEARHRAR
ncbi:MAG: RusA family crossover junction endodeoxyribonuclease [Candidatus Wallbacteria bacterium]|nr:RusA family crossover junction endodeoxyribonuclease [Candidatus Wallbacteria bacterium]